MKAWLHLAMLAWVTAVFAVMPVQAALTCRACCLSDTPSLPTKSSTPNCCAKHQATSGCCLTDRSTDGNRPANPSCPRCSQARPLPSTTVPARLQLPDLAAAACLLVPLENSAVSSQAVPTYCGTPLTISSAPQRCAVLCRWLT